MKHNISYQLRLITDVDNRFSRAICLSFPYFKHVNTGGSKNALNMHLRENTLQKSTTDISLIWFMF